MTNPWIEVCREEDIKEGRGFRVTLKERDIAIFRHRGHLYAYKNACPHQGAPLHQSHVTDEHIVCIYHGWQFHVENGYFFQNDLIKLCSYEVVERDGMVYILPD